MAKIGLDAGHYVGDGRVAKAYVSKLGTSDEYTLNLKMYNEVEKKLKSAGHTVVDIGCQDTSVTSRAKRAGSNGVDLVVSLHHNAGGGMGATLYRHTNGVKGTESKNLQNALYTYIKKVNAGNRANPITVQELGVINANNTKCPSVLIECAFMDNDTDVALINSANYYSDFAAAVVSGINDFTGTSSSSSSSSSGSSSTKSTTTTTEEDQMVADIWAKRTVSKFYTDTTSKVANVPSGDVLNVRIAPDAEAPLFTPWPALANGNQVKRIADYDNGWALIGINDSKKYTACVNASYLK